MPIHRVTPGAGPCGMAAAVWGPGDEGPRNADETRLVEVARVREMLHAAFAPGADRLVLLPYDAGVVFEPAIGRVAGLADEAPMPVVVQTLGAAGGGRVPGVFEVGPIRSGWSRAGYTGAVERALDYIRAGDAYQINLAHRLAASFRGDAAGLAARLMGAARPAYGGFVCFDHAGVRHAVVSLSPELFLEFDASTRLVRTKPMKGTRAIGDDPEELRASGKDRAELNMIVDLMRNDLGRVARAGTVHVTRARDIDAHGDSVWQATATVEALLRDGVTGADLIAAAFPAGSVTGAPKVRAAQIIRELEPHGRGPYCGSLVRVRADGSFTASVLIRTAHIVGEPDPACATGFVDAELRFPVGAGIVAESDPAAEWAETLTKAGVLTEGLAQKLRHD